MSLQQATESFTYILYKCHLEAEWDRAGGPEGLLQSLTKLAYEKYVDKRDRLEALPLPEPDQLKLNTGIDRYRGNPKSLQVTHGSLKYCSTHVE